MDEPNALSKAMARVAPMDASEALRRLQGLVQTAPDLRSLDDHNSIPTETLMWLGHLQAVVEGMKLGGDGVRLGSLTTRLVRSSGMDAAPEIRAILYRALAAAELAAPVSVSGAFVAAGSELDAYAAITKVFSAAATSLMVVDPYMDGRALFDFLPAASEGIQVMVLSDEQTHKPTLAPAERRWKSQFGKARPLEVRLTAPRLLHDRLAILDDREVWLLSQSLKDFAGRADASLQRLDPEATELKLAAYKGHWEAAKPI